MNTRDFSFYGILGGEEGIQEIVDLANDQFNNASWKSFFTWDVQQMGLTFAVLSAQSNIAPMASIIDVNSPKPLRSRHGYSQYTGSIPKMGHGYDIEEQSLRDEQILFMRGAEVNSSIVGDILFNNVTQLLQGVHNRLNNFAEQIRSTGQLIVDADNNPDGIFIEVDFRVPAANRLKAGFGQLTKLAWSDLNANPVQDLINMVKFADDNNILYGVFEMSKTLWNNFIQHPKVLAWVRERIKINTVGNPNYPVSPEEIRSALSGFELPPIVISNNRQVIEVDGEDTAAPAAFDQGNVVLRPSGILGKTKNAVSMHTLAPSTADNNRSVAEGGRIAILNQWDARKLINHIELEGWAMHTLSNPKNLVILDTTEAAS